MLKALLNACVKHCRVPSMFKALLNGMKSVLCQRTLRNLYFIREHGYNL